MTNKHAEAIELFLDRTPARSWRGLVDVMPDKEFGNLTRSTIPLLAYWIDQPLDFKSRYHFEYTVPSLGRARPSHTDLMVISDDEAWAIEGKSTEPRYETVGEWLGDSPTRSKVLDHWSSTISTVTGAQPDLDLVRGCVYQMVHRLASVCSVERDQRTMRYQLFEVGGEHPQYEQDLNLLGRAFVTGTSVALEFEVIPTALTSAGSALAERLFDAGPQQRPALIRKSLLTSELFEFEDQVITQIRIEP